MNTTHRPYSEAGGDFGRLAHFFLDDAANIRGRSTWCLGRIVDWKWAVYVDKQQTPFFTDDNAHLWFDGFGNLAGFVVSESGDAEFAILTQAGYRFLFEEMVCWALDTWADRGPGFAIEITEEQAVEAAILERHGFVRAATFWTRRFDLTRPLVPPPPLEPGFRLVDMAAHPDYRGQRLLRYNAFHQGAAYTPEELPHALMLDEVARRNPIYHAPTDICVMAPDGRLVAGCEALIDARNLEADIERVCTHSDFRQRGFARAAIVECLYRLKAMGIHSAYIMGYSEAALALYGSLGAVDEQEAYTYEYKADDNS
jgi:GNAT superfamily N-acetyltransferase